MRSQLITPEGFEKLKAELDHLWRVERPETTRKVSWAASLGDWSENADYHYNKKRPRIVGYEELIGEKDYISIDSPMAQALLDKKVDEEAIVKTPAAEFVWKIKKIEYKK